MTPAPFFVVAKTAWSFIDLDGALEALEGRSLYVAQALLERSRDLQANSSSLHSLFPSSNQLVWRDTPLMGDARKDNSTSRIVYGRSNARLDYVCTCFGASAERTSCVLIDPFSCLVSKPATRSWTTLGRSSTRFASPARPVRPAPGR